MQGMEAQAITYRIRCIRCGHRVKVTTKGSGPSLICITPHKGCKISCSDKLLGIIWGGTVIDRDIFGNVIVECK